MGGPHSARAPRAEVPSPGKAPGLRGAREWALPVGPLGAAPGKGPARFWNLLPARPPPQGPALCHLVVRAYFAVPAWYFNVS